MEAQERKYRLLRMQDYCEEARQALAFETVLHDTPQIQNLRRQWQLAQGAVSDLLHTFAVDPTQDLSRLTHCVLWFMTVHSEPLQDVKHRPMPASPEPVAPASPRLPPRQNAPGAEPLSGAQSRPRRHRSVRQALQSPPPRPAPIPVNSSGSTLSGRQALRAASERRRLLCERLHKGQEEAAQLVQIARHLCARADQQRVLREQARGTL